MTPYPPALLTLDTSLPDRHTVRIRLGGDLDYETAALLPAEVDRQLALHPATRHLRLDCSGLGVCDSMGLSVLLMVRRRTGAAGVQLHLDDRRPALDRLLGMTGILSHLVEGSGAAREQGVSTGDPR